MVYKEYEAKVKFDEDARIFHGEVINTRDVITFQGTSVEELESAFRDSVEDYLDFCKSRGEDPEKPFSGKLALRMEPKLHKRAATEARREGKSLNSYLIEAIEEHTGKEERKHRRTVGAGR